MADNLSKTSAVIGEGGSRPGSSQGQPILTIKRNKIAGGVAKGPKRPASARTTPAKPPSAEARRATISPAALNREPKIAHANVQQGAAPAFSPTAVPAAQAVIPEPAAVKSQAATQPGRIDAGTKMEAAAPAQSSPPAAKPNLLAAAAATAARLAEAAAGMPKPGAAMLQSPATTAMVPAPAAPPVDAANGTAAEQSLRPESLTSKEREKKERRVRREKEKAEGRGGERKRRRSDSPSRTGGSVQKQEVEEEEMGGGERSHRRQRRSYSSSGDDDRWRGGGYEEGETGGGSSGGEGPLRDEEKVRERRRKDRKEKERGSRGGKERRRRDRSSEERDRERRRDGGGGRGDKERHPRDRVTRYEYEDERGRYYGADDDRYDREKGERRHRGGGGGRARSRDRSRERRHGEVRKGERERRHGGSDRDRERERSRKRHRSKSPAKDKEKEGKRDGDTGKHRDKDKGAAVAKKEESLLPPPLPPPLPPAPPSPDITQHLTAIAQAHKMEFSPETGMSDAVALFDAIYRTDARLAGNEPEVWAVQQAEQQELLARMRFTAGGPPEPGIDWAKPFGPDHQRLETPLSPATATAIAAIPVAPADPSGAPPPDPRAPYAAQYAIVSGWAQRCLPVPKFAAGVEDAAPPCPAHSWSYSPPRTEIEPEIGSMAQPRTGAAPSAVQDNVLDAPAAPSHANRQSSLPSPAAEEAPQMALEEGEFAVTLPSGRERKGSLAKLVQLVASGEAPASWPAFRAADGLWVPLQEGLTLESLVVRQADQMELDGEGGNRDADLWGGGLAVDSPLRLDWMRAAATAVEDVKNVRKRQKRQQHQVLRFDGGDQKGAPGDVDLPAVAEAIDTACGEVQERARLVKADAASVQIATAPPPHILAAVQGAIMANRDLIRQVAASVLQSTLKTVVDQRMKGGGSRQ